MSSPLKGKEKLKPPKGGEKYKRAERLLNLRKLLPYSGRKFAIKHEIAASTLRDWEKAEGEGLTTDGTVKLVAAFQAEGIPCTFEWLYYGRGIDPSLGLKKDVLPSLNIIYDSASTIAQELQTFRQLHPDAIDSIVIDDSMMPELKQGCYVAGKRLFDNNIDQLIGENCIVQLQSGEVLVRKLLAGKKQNCYTLITTNPKTSNDNKEMTDVKLFSAARIIWIRRQ